MKHEKTTGRKPVRFWIRDEIEEIIKDKNIDRTRFHEYSKLRHRGIIQKFLSSFCIRKGAATRQESLEGMSLCFIPSLENRVIDCFFRTDNWNEYLNSIRQEIPQGVDRLFLLLEEGWVYEGCVDELFAVLGECSGNLEDFYIVSTRFDWFISSVEDNAVFFRRGGGRD